MTKMSTSNEVRSVAWDLLIEMADKGYRLEVWRDGYAQVQGPTTAYRVNNFACTCPDYAQRDGGSYQFPDGRRVCKHVLVVMLARPCEHCGRTMYLTYDGTYFECPNCCKAIDARIVRDERRAQGLRRHMDAPAVGLAQGPNVLDGRIPPEPNMGDLDLPQPDPDDPRTVQVAQNATGHTEAAVGTAQDADQPETRQPFRWDRATAEAAAEDTAAQAALAAYAY